MNSFELNKIVAAILIALLTIKSADLISNSLIHPKMLAENVFKIQGAPTSTAAGGPPEKTGPSPIEPLLAKANAQNGAIIFKKCTSCHTAEKGGPNKIGPDLYGVLGAPKGKHPGYTYSSAMEKKGGTWTYDDLNHYLYDPRQFVPGNKMSFVGLKNDQERADVIAYLRQQNDSPPPLPEAKPAPTPEAGKPAPTAAQPTPETGKTAPAPQPTPEAGKPAPAPQPTPEAAKPAPATQPTPEPAKPAPAPQPTPEPAKPAPAPQSTPEPAKPAPAVQPTPEAAKPAPATQPTPEPAKPALRSSSRNLENLSESLDFLNIRDPGRYWNQKFTGSRILRNPSSQLMLRERISKFRDDDFGQTGDVQMMAALTHVIIQTKSLQIS